MRTALIVAAVSGVAGSALAQPGNKSQIDLKARLWGTNDPWQDSLSIVSPNLTDPVLVEVEEFIYRNQGYGFATCTHSIVGSPFSGANGDLVTILDRPDATVHPDG